MSTIALISRDTAAKASDVLRGDLVMPIRGTWVAHLELGAQATWSDGERVTILVAGDEGKRAPNQAFVGTVRRVGAWAGRTRAVVVGGAGGLAGEIDGDDLVAPPRHPVRAQLVAERICALAGETLSDTVDTSGHAAPRWTRATSSAAEALDVLAEHFGLTWRVLDDGTVWIGEETWPAVDTRALGLEIERVPDDGFFHVGPDAATLRPGQTVLGARVLRVAYTLEGSLRAEVLVDVAGARGALPGAGERTPARPLAYRDLHVAKVVERRDDDSVDLQPDAGPMPGMRRVPVRAPFGGCRVLLEPGARVRVGFDGGDPTAPFAAPILDSDAAATRGIARVGDTVDCGWWRVASTPLGYALNPCQPTDAGAVNITGTITSGSAGALLT